MKSDQSKLAQPLGFQDDQGLANCLLRCSWIQTCCVKPVPSCTVWCLLCVCVSLCQDCAMLRTSPFALEDLVAKTEQRQVRIQYPNWLTSKRQAIKPGEFKGSAPRCELLASRKALRFRMVKNSQEHWLTPPNPIRIRFPHWRQSVQPCSIIKDQLLQVQRPAIWCLKILLHKWPVEWRSLPYHTDSYVETLAGRLLTNCQ